MDAVFHPDQKIHFPARFLVNGAWKPNPEQPERADRLLAGARAAGCAIVEPNDHGPAPIERVHTADYLRFLQTIYPRWRRLPDAPDEVVPNIHPIARPGEAPAGYPDSAVGHVGYHVLDGSSPIGPDTWKSAYASAQTAIEAAARVLDGERAAYALCRPPGHHATRDICAGFCYLANAAIAAEQLRARHERVAVIDVDVHHGNGTQQIFWRRDDVLTVSIHADPARFYPFFWGHANETGAGPGEGYNLNLPLARGTGDDDYVKTLDIAIERVAAFAPTALVVALGLDAHESDPFQGLAVTTPGFARIARALAALDLPAVLVQEGGYLSDALGDNLRAFLEGFGG